MKPYRIFQGLAGLAVLEGLFALGIFFSSPANLEKAINGGYSTSRLTGDIGLAAGLVFFLGLFAASLVWKENLSAWGNTIKGWLASDIIRLILAVVVLFALAVNLLSLSIYFIPATTLAIPFIKTHALISIVVERTYLLQIWAVLILLKIIALYFLNNKAVTANEKHYSSLIRAAIIAWSATVCVLVISLAWGLISRDIRMQLLDGPTLKLFALSIWFSLWAIVERKNKLISGKYWSYFVIGTLWLTIFLSSAQLAQWLNTLITPREGYWHLLADSFLHGKVYLTNPPSVQDLVFFNGHWYNPIPPLPAIILMPLVAIFGVTTINTTIVSLSVSATTAVLLFLILEELARLKWIELSLSGRLWLVALFAFGTVHLWLSILNRVWHFSQVCAVFFAALAFLLTLKKYPAWLIGLSLGLALMARPNLFTLWPALAAIFIQLQAAQDGHPSWKKIFRWALFSSLPVVGAVGLLLYYNFLRFGNFMDFGYTAISSGGSVVNNARQYGVFSLHFIQTNLQTMFVALPGLTAQCNYYLPRAHGISMIASTPAILYLLRRLKMEWWTIGSGLTIILSMALLATYHNDGSIQYAYRYIIDFIIPVIMLIALNAGKKISWQLKLLILASIAMNYFGTISWFFSTC